MKRTGALGAVLFVSSLSFAAYAETDPRDYAAIAPGKDKSLITLGYARAISTSDKANLSQTVGILRGLYLMKFGNFALIPFDALVPMAEATVYEYTPPAAPAPPATPLPATFRANSILEHVSGLGDLTYLPTAAYVINEGQGTSTTIAASVYVTAPTGTYDRTKVVNIGNNRWSFQPQLAIAQRISTSFTAEAVGYGIFYTDNSEFQPPPVMGMLLPLQTVKQDTTFGADVHLAYNPTPSGWLALSYYLAANGRSYFTPTVAGQAVAPEATKGPQQTIQSLRVTYGWRVEKDSLILFQFNQDISASGDGASIGRFIGARLSHTFEF